MMSNSGDSRSVAMVGAAVRLPGAASVDEFWQMLVEGGSGIGPVPAQRFGPEDFAALSPDERRCVGSGGFLHDVDLFDAAFFGLSDREAAATDPQQRLALELSWAAFEDARVAPDRLGDSRTGVYIGATADDYATLVRAADLQDGYSFTGLNRALLANRVSHLLGLRGPSLVVDSAQSASLVAVHLACAALVAGECEQALVGGVQLNVSAQSWIAAARAGVLSPTGGCHTFSAAADGFARGEGGVVVVLKPLDRAVADGDRIYCVIRGSAVNNDGRTDTLTMPSARAQAEVIRAAHRQAGIDASDVGSVELHGTGTKLGDQVESTALGEVFAERPHPVAAGSAKTNVGHLEAAAGLVGLVKQGLGLWHGIIPAQRDTGPAAAVVPPVLRVLTRSRPWPTGDRPSIAGVSAFGIGGTNCHVVLAAHHAPAEPARRHEERAWPFVVSAPSADAVRDQAGRLAEWLAARPRVPLVDVAYSLATTRSMLRRRVVITAATHAELVSGLREVAGGGQLDRPARTVDPATVFAGSGARTLTLPGYRFRRRRHWLDAASRSRAAGSGAPVGDELDLVLRHTAAVLGADDAETVDPAATFTDLGVTSVTAVELRDRLAEATGTPLPPGLVFDRPTPRDLARHLGHARAGRRTPANGRAGRAGRDEPIAIVAMACRYPGGAHSPEELWRLLDEGRDAVSAFPANRGWDLARIYDPRPGQPGRTYVREGGFLHDADRFDPAFFQISPREALAMDPQQRILLEVAWETMENAGITPASLRGTDTGVFVGAMSGGYGPRLTEAPEAVEGYALTGSAASVLSGRLAYTFGFTGPAITVDTACSSSLVALHQAARALRAGDCTMALAGGVTVMSEPGIFVEFSRQRGLSPDGRCRAFAADAAGTGWSEGVGLLLLEPLSEAVRNGHQVLGVLAGTAVNQDGASNGLTAPHGPSQERAVHAALADAGLRPSDVDAVEAHGTGTRLGDPIEAQALLDSYGADRRADAPLWLGSLKSNVGHTQAAAGVGGVIKMLLALRHETLPRTLHAAEPTPLVAWSTGVMRLLTEAVPWPRGERTRRAGVSSFGISGTNAHVIVEEAPAPADRPPPVWALRASSVAALRVRAADLLAALTVGDPELFRERARAADAGPPGAIVRAAVTGDTSRGLRALARGAATEGVFTGHARPGGTAFLFTGQGSQTPGAGHGLYLSEPVFAAAVDEIGAHFEAALERPLRAVMFAPAGHPDAALLHETSYTQAALFALEVAMYRLVESRGLTPQALLGHSVGELAAAYVAGVWSLADACRMVAARGALMQALPRGGAMVALAATEAELTPLPAGVVVAAVNAPDAVVISGAEEAVLEVARQWRERGRRADRLRVTHAFHSALMDPMLESFAEVAGAVSYAPPRLTVMSNLTGRPASAVEICTPRYWVRHVREAVRFADGLRHLADGGVRRFLELGPRPVLSALGIRCLQGEDVVFESLGHGVSPALARMYCAGADIVWPGPGAEHRRRRFEPPAHPFRRQRFWLDRAAPVAVPDLPPAGHPLLTYGISVPGSSTVLYTGRLSVADHPWLADHRLRDRIVLPGAVIVEWAAHAADRLDRAIAELVVERPVFLPEDAVLEVRLVADPATIAVFSGNDAAGWTRHASVTLEPAGHPGPEPAPAIGAGVVVDVVEHYRRLAERGFRYGPAFRALRDVRRDDEGVSAVVELPSDVAPDGYAAHPVLLDAALHAALILVPQPPGAVPLPFAWTGVTVRRTTATEVHVRIAPRGPSALSITATDARGAEVLSVRRLLFRPLPLSQLDGVRTPRDVLLRSGWVALGESPSASVVRCGVLGTDHLGLSGAVKETNAYPSLRDLDAEVRSGAAVPETVLVCGGEGLTEADAGLPGAVRSAVERALVLMQHWIDDDACAHATLVFITRGAVAAEPGADVADIAAAAVWAAVRSAQREHPGRFRLIDLDDGPDASAGLRRALGSGEPQLAVRRGEPRRPELVPEHGGPAGAAGLDPEGTVLITGGTGALGALFARHLVRTHGVRHVLLLSRRGPDAPGATELAAELGSAATIMACDVADRAQVRGALAGIPAELPLTAVVHTAGLVRDSMLTLMTPRRVDAVMRPKVDAAVHLHELTAGQRLSAFVLFSSVIGVLGGPGQANYAAANAALDALACRRAAAGLPALALAWGPWAGEGMAGELSIADRRRMERAGYAELPVAKGLELFDAALARPDATVMAAVRLSGDDGAAISALLPRAVPEQRGQTLGRASGGWSELSADEVLQSVLGQAAAVLGHSGPEAVDPDGELWDSGFDSLTALELSQRLSAASGLHLPPTLVFDHPTAGSIARRLVAMMASG
ncbi:hypothetical protein GCM10012284_21200 [Mangrovihabitans endophyticus]|uniref:Acyl transferase domain-containing protein n=1 Tax=Mangrovihabitans endophyticus TaxID=1751298 RepID=A0A8J3FNG0_9ACTN|nr:type I polyketide synthase [Mangrovihabitans endophyticus]GGK86780.1 hypothetical protein GCM10012284_21200 [Mangrovihabitans endophyticus]